MLPGVRAGPEGGVSVELNDRDGPLGGGRVYPFRDAPGPEGGWKSPLDLESRGGVCLYVGERGAEPATLVRSGRT